MSGRLRSGPAFLPRIVPKKRAIQRKINLRLCAAEARAAPPRRFPFRIRGTGRERCRQPSACATPQGRASASWLNAVEGFFAKLTRRRLKRGVFHSLVALQEAINRFVAKANADPRPFRWTKQPDHIIAAAKRGHQTLDLTH